jgi:exodeoxyribonuclease-3
MPFKIATWNVNSINARLPTVLEVLAAIDADVVCLQELKCEDTKFPFEALSEVGYDARVLGQKTYNGVAILSRHRFEEHSGGLPGFDTPQARYLEAVIAGPDGPWRVASIYAPNGNPVDTDKFPYKLAFMQALTAHARGLLALEERVVLAGDYNVIPRPEDCYDPRAWEGDALFRPESRAALRGLINLGYTDAFGACDGRAHQYTFWDYQAGAWQKDHGIRIDHHLTSPRAADRLQAVEIARSARGRDKPSDHVPILATFLP